MPKAVTMETSKIKEGGVGLNYPMLAKSNYAAWSLKMKVYMQADGVWEAVEPKDPKSTVEERTDKVALAVIYQGIPEDVFLSLEEKKTVKEAWEAIKTMCLGADRVKKVRVQTLKAEFESMCMKETKHIDDFCMKLNSLVTNIRALGEEVEESYVVKKLLRAVPTKFLQIASTIEQFGDVEKMSVEETVGSLKAHEERLKGQSENNNSQLLLIEEEWTKREASDGKLLMTKEEWSRRANKNSGGTFSNQRSPKGGRVTRDKSRVRCFNCHLYGHFAAECRKPKRDKDQKPKINMAQIDDEEPALLLTEHEENGVNLMLLNEEKFVPKLSMNKNEKRKGSDV